MKTVLFCSAMAAVCAATTDTHMAFQEFLVKYGRSYASKSEIEERFDIFAANLETINNHNARADSSYRMAVNQFADLTEEEFSQRYLSATMNKGTKKPELIKSKRPALQSDRVPDQVDWNAAGKVSTPRDQGNCGSCWAFTTATTLESLNAIENDLVEVPDYSVQYLVDCDAGNFGCGGGWMLDAYDFTKSEGIVNWKDYPRGYLGRVKDCRAERKMPRFYNKGGEEEDFISNFRMKQLVAKQPLGVAIYSNPKCLNFYQNGILKEEDCHCSNPDRTEVNHAVTLVGYGKSDEPGCDEYWLIKNSWGPAWGEQGFFRFCMDETPATEEVGTCQINSYVMYPTS